MIDLGEMRTCRIIALSLIAAVATAQPAPRTVRETQQQWNRAPLLSVTEAQRWCKDPTDAGCDFSDISSAVALPDGGIIAVNLSGPIHRFDPRGGFVGAISRKGRGPGEYRFVVAPQLISSGNLAWYDQALRRVTTISLDGTPLPSPQLQPPLTIADVGLSGGGLIVYDVPSAPKLGDTVEASYHTVVESGASRVLAKVRTPSVFAPGSPMQAWPAPFTPRALSGIGWSGDIAHSNGGQYDVHVFPSQGVAWRLEVALPPRAVTEDEHRAALAQVLVDARVRTVEELPPPIRAQLARASSMVPPLQEVRVLRDGTIWLKPTPPRDARTARWDVFSRGGERIGQVRLPQAARLVDGSRGWILTVEPAADDVPTVVKYLVSK